MTIFYRCVFLTVVFVLSIISFFLLPHPLVGADVSTETGASAGVHQHSDGEADQILMELKDAIGLEPEEMKRRLEIVFDFIDTNQNGVLEDEEVKTWLGKLKNSLMRKEVVAEIEKIDKDGDKKITFEELKAAYADAESEQADEDTLKALRRRFDAVDNDHDNSLSFEEVATLLIPGSNEELLKLEMEDVLSAQDKDNDRKISLEEFMSAEESLRFEDKEPLNAEFKGYDSNGDGFIDEEELRQIIAEPHRQQVIESLQELKELWRGKVLVKNYFLDKFHKFVISPVTDNGKLLSSPEEYGLDLPFENVVRDDEVDSEEL